MDMGHLILVSRHPNAHNSQENKTHTCDKSILKKMYVEY